VNAAEADLSFVELATAMRAYADGPRQRAAVELLIEHRHWLLREPFRSRVDYYSAQEAFSGVALADPDWAALGAMADDRSALHDTDSEIGVLRVACSIGGGWLGAALTSCDQTNVQLIGQAVLTAGGVTR